MNNFQHGGGARGGSRGFGGRGGHGGHGGRNDGEREMHKAVCAECGNNCEVPFRPNGLRPVLCSDCYGNDGGARRNDSPRSAAPAVDNSAAISRLEEQLAVINEKLDVLIDVLTMEEEDLEDISDEDLEEAELAEDGSEADKE